MYNITLLDRMIINSVTKRNTTCEKIAIDTDLSQDIVSIVVEDLIIKNIIVLQSDGYRINQNLNKEQVDEINSKDSIDIEKIQIAKSSLKNENGFEIKRFSLSQKDKVIFDGMLENIKLFIENSKIKNASTKDESLFFWGQDNYSKIVKSTIY